MFCENCGKPVEGEKTLCDACAAARTAQTEIIAEEPAAVYTETAPTEPVYTEPTPVMPVFSEPAPAEKKAPKKKKRGLVAAIIAVAAVAAATVAVVLNLNSINGFIGRTFKSPEDYFADVERAAIAEHTAEFTQAYGKALSNYNSDMTAADMDIHLTIGDSLMSLVESALQQQGMNMNIDWLQDIALSLDTNVQGDAIQMALGVGLDAKTLLTADMIMDMENGKTYLTIPELNDQYLSVDMSSAMDMGEFQSALTQSQQISEGLIKALPSEEELNELVNTYVDIALSGIKDVEKENDTLSVGGESQKVVVLTAKIKAEDLLDIAEDMLKQAEDDKTLKKIINGFGDYVNEINTLSMGSYYEPIDLYEQLQEAIPFALEGLESAKENADSSNYLKLKVYVDMQNQIRGHELSVYADGEEMNDPFSWLTVKKGNTTYTEAEFAEVEITGEGTEKKGISEGYYELTVSGQTLGKLEYENVSENGGTLRLVPSEEIMSTALSGSGLPTSLLGDNMALELIYATESDTKGSFEINIVVGSQTLIGLGMSSEASKGGKVSIPSDAVDINNQTGLIQWIQDADFDTVLDNLESAGIPKDLVDAVRYYTDMIN